MEIFALNFKVGLNRIAVRRPLQYEVGNAQVALARELITNAAEGAALILKRIAILHSVVKMREARAPTGRVAKVATHMEKSRAAVAAIFTSRLAGEILPAADFGAKFEEQWRWRKPFGLQAVLAILPA